MRSERGRETVSPAASPRSRARGRAASPGSRASTRRGTASVEVVVMLPVFVILFASGFYLHGLITAAQDAGIAARGCAWAHAVAGCPTQRPSLCRELQLSDPKALDAADYEPRTTN